MSAITVILILFSPIAIAILWIRTIDRLKKLAEVKAEAVKRLKKDKKEQLERTGVVKAMINRFAPTDGVTNGTMIHALLRDYLLLSVRDRSNDNHNKSIAIQDYKWLILHTLEYFGIPYNKLCDIDSRFKKFKGPKNMEKLAKVVSKKNEPASVKAKRKAMKTLKQSVQLKEWKFLKEA